MASGCIHAEASFVSLDDLEIISILSNKDNDLEEEITHLYNEVYLILSLKKSVTNEALNIRKTCAVTRDNFERF